MIGAVMLAVGLFVAWPTKQRDETAESAGKELFEKFKDPLVAASLKIVSFDESQGKVDTFEVRRDRQTGVWSIPSRKGYPADGVEQMKNAANALVGLKILDVQTRNAEDHEALGVVEPKLESLEVGDVGVGRLVTFRDESQKNLASLIIGNPVKDEEGRRYVRKPGQDPVYVVQLDEATLSTKFQDWIEDDLLQLSSIDIKSLRIEDYAATVTGRGFALDRNYTAEVVADGSDWRLEKLLEYPSEDSMAPPVEAQVDPELVANKEKLDAMKNALDDLKIVDVVRKPEGMSANLRANQDLVSDNEAVQSLVDRGFLPVQAGAEGPVEIYAANGELDVTLNDGVQYVLRFGNVSGLGDEEDSGDDENDGQEDSPNTSVNRFMLVTTRVDEKQFPAPALKPVPQTIEELAAMLGAGQPEASQESEKAAERKPAEEMKSESSTDAKKDEAKAEDAKSEKKADAGSEKEMSAEEPAEDSPKQDKPAEDGDKKEKSKQEKSEEDKSKDDKPTGDEKSQDAAKKEKPADEKPADKKSMDEKSADSKSSDENASKEKSTEDKSADEKPAEPKKPEKDSAEEKPAEKDKADKEPAVEEVEVEGGGEASGEGQGQDPESGQDSSGEESSEEESSEEKSEAMRFSELTDEEKHERLEAEQEKILKANTRLLDERKDRINAAERRVGDLNARFADWYYVIPETTYSELRIARDELMTTPEAAEEGTGAAPGPGFPGGGAGSPIQIPGLNAPQ